MGPGVFSHVRMRTLAFVLLALAAVVGPGLRTAPAASSAGSVVGAEVLASTTVGTTACGSLDAGSLTVGATVGNLECSVDFGSSNSSARLVVRQRDADGAAMTSFEPTWLTRRGSPTLYDADFGSSSVGWVVGRPTLAADPPVLRRTTDGGTTWSAQTPCTGATQLSGTHAFSATDALVAGNVLCRTTNGGTTWSAVSTPSAPCAAIDGSAGSDTVYMACGSGRVMRSDDRGATWVSVNAPTSHGFHYIAVQDALTAYVAASTTIAGDRATYVWRTTDGGATWSSTHIMTLTGQYTGWTTIDVSPTGTIIGTGWGGMGVWRSTDVGASFTKVANFNFHGSASIGTTWLGSAYDLSTYRSTDDGFTWSTTTVSTSSPDRIEGMSADVDGLRFVMVGVGDTVTRSTDGGFTWSEVSSPYPTYETVVHFEGRAFAAFGTAGNAVRSSDGGSTISTLSIPTTNALRDSVRTPRGTGIVVGASGTILRSTDRGATWQLVPSPTAGSLRSVDVAQSEGTLHAVTTGGIVIRSVDDGATWQLRPSTGIAAVSIAVSDDGTKLWVGGGADLRASTDGGETWSVVTSAYPTQSLTALEVLADGALLATHTRTASLESRVARSTDGGGTWSSSWSTSATLADIVGVGSTVWVVGESSLVSRSVDGGVTFSDSSAAAGTRSAAATLSAIAVADTHTAVAVGSGETVITIQPSVPVPDFHPTTANFSSSAGAFGVCLEDSGTAVSDWTEPGTCDTAVAVHWNPVLADPAAPAAVAAHTNGAGLATVELDFALRVGATQLARAYRADVAFDVIAPNA